MNQNTDREPAASTGKAHGVAPRDHRQCFRNEYNSGGTQQEPDVVLLIVDVAGENVDGTYDWLPAYKDRRRGIFNGKIDGSYVTALYEFQQEGLSQSAAISIVLQRDMAIVTGGPEELGLAASIARINCQSLEP